MTGLVWLLSAQRPERRGQLRRPISRPPAGTGPPPAAAVTARCCKASRRMRRDTTATTTRTMSVMATRRTPRRTHDDPSANAGGRESAGAADITELWPQTARRNAEDPCCYAELVRLCSRCGRRNLRARHHWLPCRSACVMNTRSSMRICGRRPAGDASVPHCTGTLRSFASRVRPRGRVRRSRSKPSAKWPCAAWQGALPAGARLSGHPRR